MKNVDDDNDNENNNENTNNNGNDNRKPESTTSGIMVAADVSGGV